MFSPKYCLSCNIVGLHT